MAAAVPCLMYPSLPVSTQTLVTPLDTSLGDVLKKLAKTYPLEFLETIVLLLLLSLQVLPSKLSASNPLPEPSTVLRSVSISLAV